MNALWRIAIVSAAALGIGAHASQVQQTVEATLLSNSIKLDTHSVRPGRVAFHIRNAADNKMAHEFVVLKTGPAADALPVRNGAVLEQKLRKIGEAEDIAPGKSKRLALKLAPGRYTLICNKPGHYACRHAHGAGCCTVMAAGYWFLTVTSSI